MASGAFGVNDSSGKQSVYGAAMNKDFSTWTDDDISNIISQGKPSKQNTDDAIIAYYYAMYKKDVSAGKVPDVDLNTFISKTGDLRNNGDVNYNSYHDTAAATQKETTNQTNIKNQPNTSFNTSLDNAKAGGFINDATYTQLKNLGGVNLDTANTMLTDAVTNYLNTGKQANPVGVSDQGTNITTSPDTNVKPMQAGDGTQTGSTTYGGTTTAGTATTAPSYKYDPTTDTNLQTVQGELQAVLAKGDPTFVNPATDQATDITNWQTTLTALQPQAIQDAIQTALTNGSPTFQLPGTTQQQDIATWQTTLQTMQQPQVDQSIKTINKQVNDTYAFNNPYSLGSGNQVKMSQDATTDLMTQVLANQNAQAISLGQTDYNRDYAQSTADWQQKLTDYTNAMNIQQKTLDTANTMGTADYNRDYNKSAADLSYAQAQLKDAQAGLLGIGSYVNSAESAANATDTANYWQKTTDDINARNLTSQQNYGLLTGSINQGNTLTNTELQNTYANQIASLYNTQSTNEGQNLVNAVAPAVASTAMTALLAPKIPTMTNTTSGYNANSSLNVPNYTQYQSPAVIQSNPASSTSNYQYQTSNPYNFSTPQTNYF